eukprot:scaffold148111_cov48-Attheya_sp.AAC.2
MRAVGRRTHRAAVHSFVQRSVHQISIPRRWSFIIDDDGDAPAHCMMPAGNPMEASHPSRPPVPLHRRRGEARRRYGPSQKIERRIMLFVLLECKGLSTLL